MTKQQFIKLMGNVDDDIIENYLGTPVDENRPIKLRVTGGSSAFAKYAGIAAAVVCVAALAIFTTVKLRQIETPGYVPSGSNVGSSGGIEQGPYTVEIIGGNDPNEYDIIDVGGSDIDTISIGDFSYNVELTESARSASNDRIYDVYRVDGSPDKTIGLDRETKEVVYFSNIAPYPAIENFGTLSDEELKAAAEKLMSDVDFSQYEHFEALHSDLDEFKSRLNWQVERDLLCDIGISVYVTENGSITLFRKTDACPDDLYKSFISDDERDRLLEGALHEYLKELDIKASEYAEFYIMSETLSAFRGKDCVIYDINIIDKEMIIPVLARITDNSDYREQDNSSDISTESSDTSSTPDPEPVDIGNGMTLTGTPLDHSELEEFIYPPFEFILSEEDENFFDGLEIPNLKEQYERAAVMITCLSTSELPRGASFRETERTSAGISVENIDPNGLGQTYYEWGYTYESFYNAFLSAFTEDALEEIFDEYDFFLNYDGELFCAETASGGNAWVGGGVELHHEFELISKSDTAVELRRYGWWDEKNRSLEYDPALRDEYEEYFTDFKFVMTENGWRAATAVWIDQY